MIWGTRLERAILDGYAEDTGRKVIRGGRRFRRHPTIRFIVGHPDAETDDRIVEAKTAASLDERWGPAGSEQIPLPYYAQVQHYMILRDKPLADLVVLVSGREMRLYSIPANPEFQEALVKDEADFWERVEKRIPPPPDGSDSAAAVLRRQFPHAIREDLPATRPMADRMEAYLTAKTDRDNAEREMEQHAQVLQQFMGARDRLLAPGLVASWGERQGSPSWKSIAGEARITMEMLAGMHGPGGNHEAVAREFVEGWDALIERHRGSGSRVFTITRKVREER